ncbi:MAG: YfhO family protein [Lachnospiraceae bacterium]|nr:YfhO family protein [Lachnospiraceae bacterium]
MSKKNKPVKATQYTFKDRLPLLLAFAIPVFIMILIFAGKGIYPFGEMSFLRIDLYHQYAPFHTDLLRRLQSGASLTYAWDIGLGSNYVALFAYYLSSPFNLLLFFMKPDYITEYIGFMAILKTGLASLTMAWYLSSRSGRRTLAATFFGVCYAMCGYFAAYNWNIMWLDCLWLAPLVILGLERLVKENRPFLYCVALALSILTNYYISIMLCMFLVLYFLCLLIMVPQKNFMSYLGKIGQFALFSLIAGGIAAILLLPAYFALSSTASAWSKTTFPSTLTNYFAIFDMLGRHLMLVETELGLEHWPNLYSGVAALIFLPLYYMNRRVSYKEKIVKTVLLVVMLLSFSFNIPNYIWHGLHYPNSLPCRQSFLYTIILLSMCHEGARGLRTVNKGRIAAIFFGAAAFILVAEKLITAPEFHYWSYYISLLFVALYCLFFYMYRNGQLKEVFAFTLALIVLVLETGANMAVTSVTITSRTAYWDHVKDYQELLASTGDEDLFYRVDKMSRKSKDDGTFINYNSASIFSSTTHAGISDIYRKLGMEGNTNAYCVTGATPFMESILSVKYRLSLNELPESPLYRLAGEQNGAYLYENLYTLPLGFMIGSDAEDAFISGAGTPFRAQNRLASLLGGEGNVLSQIPGSVQGSEYTTSVSERAHIFAYVENSSIDSVDAEVGGVTKSFSNVRRRYLLDLGYCEPGTNITLSTDEDETLNASIYAFDDEAFIANYQKIAEGGLQLESFKNELWSTYLKGTVTAKEDQVLFLSIPYEKGWTVKVDGEVTETDSFYNAFMMVPMSAGTHTVELSYMPEGLKLGAFITLASLAMLLILFIIYTITRTVRRRRMAEEGGPELIVTDDGEDDYIFELTDGEQEKSAGDGEIHIAVNDETEEPPRAEDFLQMPEVIAAQELAAEDAAETPAEAPVQTAAADPVAALAAEAAAALSEEPPVSAHGEGTLLSDNTSVLRALEAGNDEAIRQMSDTAGQELPGGEPDAEDLPEEIQEYAGEVPEIEYSDAENDSELAFEEAEPEPIAEAEEPAAKRPAPDPYETQMLEAILAELESKD